MKTRSGRLGVGAEAAHHANDEANAAATEFERADGRLIVEAAAARHMNEDANAAVSHRVRHADGGLVVEDAAARHFNEETNGAAEETEQAESRLVAEATTTCDRGDDTNAAAAASKEKVDGTEVMSRPQENKHEKTNEGDDEIRRLIEERRNTVEGDKHHLKELSKKIKKCIRDRKRTKRQEKTQRILQEFRGIKSISCIKSGRNGTLIPKEKNDKGETITSRKGIANVFGEFYSKLYNLETRMNTEKTSCNEDVRNEIPEFTQDEVQATIDNLKKGKQMTTTESGPKTSRHATKRRKKRSDRSLTNC